MKDETAAKLRTVTRELADADESEKKAKARKEAARKKFFELVSQAVVEDRPLRRKVVDVPDTGSLATEEEQVEEWRLKNEPGWRVLKVSPSKRPGMAYVVALEEDPSLLKFTYVNDEIHKVFGRTTEERGAYFDSEALRQEVTNDVEAVALAGAFKEKTVYEFDELHAQLVLSLNPELMPMFQKHAHPGKLSAKLMPIRVAKEEEVE